MPDLRYTLNNNANGRFAINATTGVLTVANGAQLDYEAATSHQISVRTTDQAGLTFDKTSTIGVTDVNEVPTNATLTSNTVAETADIAGSLAPAMMSGEAAGGNHVTVVFSFVSVEWLW
jgi:hypothetical protein